ncbi:DUF350 domain-containing protein [candidate division KSB1 bacterium]|nr:DUF350 domain-containing protein [candidate division KSB1 bacterium]
MSLDQFVSGLIYLGSAFVLFFLGKWAYGALHRNYALHEELLERDNFALALVMIGYHLGLVFAIGGVLAGVSVSLIDDLIDIFLYGAASIVLLNLSGLITDKFILPAFDDEKEIIQDRNAGTGAIVAANHIATGLIIAGAISGRGSLLTAALSWILGQLALVIASRVYSKLLPYDVHANLEKDNVAVGVAFAGMQIAVGNLVRVSITGDFISWSDYFIKFGSFLAFGLILLPLIRIITDRVLLPGKRLTAELVNQAAPNVGAGAIEAFSYIAASLLLSWVV